MIPRLTFFVRLIWDNGCIASVGGFSVLGYYYRVWPEHAGLWIFLFFGHTTSHEMTRLPLLCSRGAYNTTQQLSDDVDSFRATRKGGAGDVCPHSELQSCQTQLEKLDSFIY